MLHTWPRFWHCSGTAEHLPAFQPAHFPWLRAGGPKFRGCTTHNSWPFSFTPGQMDCQIADRRQGDETGLGQTCRPLAHLHQVWLRRARVTNHQVWQWLSGLFREPHRVCSSHSFSNWIRIFACFLKSVQHPCFKLLRGIPLSVSQFSPEAS